MTATLREARSAAGREAGSLLSLAWPVALAYLGTVGMGVVDTMMVGRLGAAPLAAVALANAWNFGIVILALGAVRGLDPVVSQAHGAADKRTAGLGLSLGMAMAALLAPFVITMFGLADPALRLLGQPQDLIGTAASYCRALIWGVPGLLGFIVGRQFLQAVGEMRPGTVAVFLANGINALLNWMLIYGKLGLPALGALGSGYATSVAQWFMLVALVVLGRRRFREYWLGWRAQLPWRSLGRLLVLGLPVGFQMGLEVWAFHAAGLLMGRMGTHPLAAHAIAINLSTVSFMVPSGLSAAAATRVGHLLGAGREWMATARIALALGAAVMVVPAVVFTFFPGDLATLYTKDASVVAVAAALLPLAGMFQLFDGVQVVAFGVLRGVGDVNVPSIANAIGYWMLGLPVGWALAFRLGWGPRGIWIGLALALAAVAVLLVMRVGWIGKTGGIRRLVDP